MSNNAFMFANKTASDWIKAGVGFTLNTLALVSSKWAGQLAWNIFSKPRTAKRMEHDPDLIRSAQTHLLSWEGLSVRYYLWPAAGPLVLLAHGWESNASRWKPLITVLREAGYAVLAPDAPAHGASEGVYFNAAMYAEVLKELVQRHPTDSWIGHSAGGMAAIYLAYKYPQLTPDRLALLGVPADLERLLTYYQRTLGLSQRTLDAMKAQFQATFQTEVSDFSMPRFLEQISTPNGLILHDYDDDIAPVAGALEMHACWKTSSLVLTRGLGHSLKDDSVTRRILDWLVGGSGQSYPTM